jgi:hypothetical protein
MLATAGIVAKKFLIQSFLFHPAFNNMKNVLNTLFFTTQMAVYAGL